ncbi:MAG: tRNA epoxyqueuosine(34) reductase QueG [Bacteroidetes bacterium]|nr:tRNA epoxyqueuosine(34) reductase QueG [Bacteroidota bacterium]
MSSSITSQIKQQLTLQGFDLVGISKAGFLEKEAKDLEQWLHEGRHGTMSWMENHFDKRVDPRLLVEGAKSVISVLLNYFPDPSHHQPADAPKISTYAWGEDYHKVIKNKLHRVLEWIQANVGEVNARIFTDSAPVMDKAWATRGGLGWIGKNTNLIHPKMGSWYFIGEIILDLELEYDGPMKDYCGTCTKCIDACPTEALTPYQIDSRKCISYLTIELRENIPPTLRAQTENWAYGCDICQQVCPWNSFATPNGGDFKPLSHILELGKAEWAALDEKQFKKLTKHSAMSRVKWDKMEQNLQNSQNQDLG